MLHIKWPQVLDIKDRDSKPICRWIDLCNGTLFRITAFFTFTVNNMPREGLFIGIERVGCFLFGLENKMSWYYVSEKLNLGNEADCRILADWINAQLGNDCKQQGIYTRHYIEESEPYGLIGEKFYMPLVPHIIDEI